MYHNSRNPSSYPSVYLLAVDPEASLVVLYDQQEDMNFLLHYTPRSGDTPAQVDSLTPFRRGRIPPMLLVSGSYTCTGACQGNGVCLSSGILLFLCLTCASVPNSLFLCHGRGRGAVAPRCDMPAPDSPRSKTVCPV